MNRLAPSFARLRAAPLAVACAMGLSQAALAQSTYPTKPIRMVSMHTGVADGYTRLLTGKMSESIGQPIVVDAMLGAGGGIAAEAAARAAPDGYTILAAFPDAIVLRHLLVRKMTYDPVKDFTPIVQLMDPIIVLAVEPNVAGDIKDLLAKAKAAPNKLSYGSLGIGSSFQLAGEAVKQLTGVEIIHVPFKSSADSMVAVQRGDVSMLYTAQGVVLPQHRAGKMKIIGVVNDRRSPALPDVPSIREVVPGFESPPFWLGYFGPANLPGPITQRLNGEFIKAAKIPELAERAGQIGFSLIGSTPDEFRTRVREGIEKSNKIAKGAGIEPE